MKSILLNLCLPLGLLAAVPATAAVVEFEMSGLLMEDRVDPTPNRYRPTGVFRLDTETLAVWDVAVSTRFADYTEGSARENSIIGHDFLAVSLWRNDLWYDDILDIYETVQAETLTFRFLQDDLFTELAGLIVGDGFSIEINLADEYDSRDSDLKGSGVTALEFPSDPGIINPRITGVVIRADVPAPSTVPLPAGLPLLAAALAGFGMLRRRGKAA